MNTPRKPLNLEPAIRHLRKCAELAMNLACDHLGPINDHEDAEKAMFCIANTQQLARELEAALDAGDVAQREQAA